VFEVAVRRFVQPADLARIQNCFSKAGPFHTSVPTSLGIALHVLIAAEEHLVIHKIKWL